MAVDVFNSAIRNHFAIENNLIWCLGVVFKEDRSKRRKGYRVVNYSLITKIALKIIEKIVAAMTKPKNNKPLS